MITTLFHCKSDPTRRVLVPQGTVVSTLPMAIQNDVLEPGTDVTYDALVPPETFDLDQAQAAVARQGYFEFQDKMQAGPA